MLVLVIAWPGVAAPRPSVADRAAEFMSTAPAEQAYTRREQRESINERFDELGLFEALDLAISSDPESADALFRATQHAFFYTAADRYLHDMERMLKSLEQAGAATAQHYTMWYRALIQSRRFAKAAKMRAMHGTPQMAPLPEFVDSVGIGSEMPSMWKVESPSRIARVPLEYERYKIIVVSHPNCGYTRRAAEAIESSPALSQLFDSNALWLAPQDANLNIETFWQWNQAHPTLPIALIHRADELPEIARWATPTFYFLKRGRVVATVVGWPKGGRREELIASAKAAGLVRTGE